MPWWMTSTGGRASAGTAEAMYPAFASQQVTTATASAARAVRLRADLQEVAGMGGEAEAQRGEPGREHPHECRVGEVRVEVLHAIAARARRTATAISTACVKHRIVEHTAIAGGETGVGEGEEQRPQEPQG